MDVPVSRRRPIDSEWGVAIENEEKPVNLFDSLKSSKTFDLSPSIDPGTLIGADSHKCNEIPAQQSIPITATQNDSQMGPVVKELSLPLLPEHTFSKPLALNLAMQGGATPLIIDTARVNEIPVVCQAQPQPEAGTCTAKQQRSWFRSPWGRLTSEAQTSHHGASVGKSLQLKSFRNVKCWEISGPARELWDRILPDIKEILACCSEDIIAKEPAPLPMVVAMYMIGKDEQNAIPTILFSCQSRALRRKAMKFVKKSILFQTLEGVLLAESKDTPSSMGSSEEQRYPSPVERPQQSNIYVFAPTPTSSPCGTRIYISNEKEKPAIINAMTTLGGILQQGSSYYGLTVAHSFFKADEVQTSEEGSVDFSFDDSDDSEYFEDTKNFEDTERIPDMSHPPLLMQEKSPYSGLGGPGLLRLGRESTMLYNNDLDYAVIYIDLEFFKATNRISFDVNGAIQHKIVQDLLKFPDKDCKIIALKGSKGAIKGEISGVPYIVKMPFGKKFQEVRLVRLENNIEYGDCGSWIVNLESGGLYGAIVIGYPNTKIAYISPAVDILEDIRLQTSLDITLSRPAESSIQKASRTSYLKHQLSTTVDEISSLQDASNSELAISKPDQLKRKSSKFIHGNLKAKLPRNDGNQKTRSKQTEKGLNYSYDSIPDNNYLGARLNAEKSVPKEGEAESTPLVQKTQKLDSIVANGMPENMGFLWSIDSIRTVYNDEHRPRYLSIEGSNDVGKYWYPPILAKMFRRHQGNLYRWRMGESTRLNDSIRPLDKFDTTSLFFQAKQNNFVAVNKDCTRLDIIDEELGWSHIGFEHLPGFISAVYIGADKFELAAPADGASWMPQVLPQVYNYASKSPIKPTFDGISGGLCGSLSLLFGMAAFSAPVEDQEFVISKCFGLDGWSRHAHEIGIGRYQERGVVVSIYLDPEAKDVTADHLRAFERGEYGPIFEATDCFKSPHFEKSYSTEQHFPIELNSLPRTLTSHQIVP